MDLHVYLSQQWLNATYSNVSGFNAVSEDGITGWETIFALRRALQHELGILDLSDNFGAMTLSNLDSQFGDVSESTSDSNANVIGILQCGLWCKGYWGDNNFGVWTDLVAGAITSMRIDMGLGASPTVPPKVFKSLLSLDAYTVISGGTTQVQTIQKWLNSHYLDRLDYYIVPADGVYSRDVQQGLVFALQYEVGMPDGVANGNFGPGTQQGVRDYGNFGLNSTDGARRMVSLFQAALIFNGYSDTPFSGTFNNVTQAQTSAFQGFSELAQTGSANFATWASLLVSTGDPTRMTTACDTNVQLTENVAAQLFAAGYRSVGRYVNGEEKRFRFDEADTITSAGLKWVPIYQEANDAAKEFSTALGEIQGQRLAMRMRQLGIKSGRRVYLAVDFDATSDDIPALIIPHFQAVKAAMSASRSVTYRLGVYSTRNVCAKLAAQSITESSFVSDMSTGYSGNLGFGLPADWAYDQIANIDPGTNGVSIEIDKDVASVRAEALTSADQTRTPRKYSGSTPTGYDEDFYWRFAALAYRAEGSTSSSQIPQSVFNEILLTGLQKPAYWDPKWSVFFTPPIETRFAAPSQVLSTISAASADFESAIGDDLYSRPVADRFGQTDHWAASTRGYTAWGIPSVGTASVQNGDLGSWALDLVQAWNDYEAARIVSPGGVLAVRSWFATQVGVDSPSFGEADFRADMAAFLVAKRIDLTTAPPVDQVVRDLLVAAEDDPGYLAKQFFTERFGARAAVVSSAQSVFSNSSWTVQGFARDNFLHVRAPGTDAPTLNPSASILAAELSDLANGFADALETAKLWTRK